MTPTKTSRNPIPDDLNDETTDMEQVQSEYERSKVYEGMFKPKTEGQFRLRILPPITKGLFYGAFGMHYALDELRSFGDRRSTICPRLTYKHVCPICVLEGEWGVRGMNAAAIVNQPKQQIANAIRAKPRYVMNVVDMDNPQAGVMTWELFAQVFEKQILLLFQEWGNLTSPKTGRVLKATYARQKDYLTCQSVQVTQNQDPIPVQNWRETRKDFQQYIDARAMPEKEMQQCVDQARVLWGQEASTSTRAPGHQPEAATEAMPWDVPGVSEDDDDLEPGSDVEETDEIALDDPAIQALGQQHPKIKELLEQLRVKKSGR